ncbi:MAG TPA: bifunctional 2-polyprenyl-6-hydroxyphenol methylase/3-demethylubiquinol 3-O-methyltransferase UbiG [Caulobacterales bacterium]|nr:bifunctional 2-polyprenyl-6-hydroxyphenol methylase/3-demethylubiquinol 3-O-methyltransferase UbiG [Caulobacterales bacterium]
MAEASPRSTLDAAEIEKFSALARQWWDPKGPFGALHRMNPVRLNFIRERAERQFGGSGRFPLKGLSILDIGCGGGLISAPLARLGGEITAVDASEEAIGAARAHAERAGLEIDFRVTTAEALAAQNARYDIVVAMEIIEHVADVQAFLTSAAALVKPGGLLLLSTINRTPKARALAIVGAEKILQWAPDGAHEYEKLVRPEEIRAAAPEIVWEEPIGISYNPIGAGWSLSRDTDVNYLMAGTKPK